MVEFQFECYSDGGANNKTRSNAYGSYAIFLDGYEIMRAFHEFDDAETNNEAEYLALISLLRFINQYDRENYNSIWNIFIDSQLVHDQILGTKNTRAENLVPLKEEAKKLIESIVGEVKLNWVGRKKIVKVLGH